MHYAVACRTPRCLAYAVGRNGRKDAHHYTCYAPCLQLACPSWCDQLVMPVDPFLGSIAVIATVDLVQLLLALEFRTKTNVRLMSWQINPLIGLLFHKLVYSYSISIFAKLYACKPNNPYNICVCPRCFSIELIFWVSKVDRQLTCLLQWPHFPSRAPSLDQLGCISAGSSMALKPPGASWCLPAAPNKRAHELSRYRLARSWI